MVLRTTLFSRIRGIINIDRRQEKRRRRPIRRLLHLEALETRCLLTGEPIYPIPNDDPVINPTENSKIDRHESFDRIALANHDPNELAENHALLAEKRDERTPPFHSSHFELGDMQGNWYSGPGIYPVDIPLTPGGYYQGPRGVYEPRSGDAPRGFFDFQGPSADDYVAEENYFDVRDPALDQYIPDVPTWALGDNLHLFVPDPMVGGTTTETAVHVFSTNPDPDTTIDYDLNSTLVILTVVGSNGAWAYEATLVTTYDVVTTYDTPEIDWVLHQWGSYRYEFTAFGAEVIDNYEVETVNIDDFTDTYVETMSGGNGTSIIDQGTYNYQVVASRSRGDQLVGTVALLPDGSYVTDYTESGGSLQEVDFDASGAVSYSVTIGNVANGDGVASTETGALTETHHRENGDLYNGTGTIVVAASGARSKTGQHDSSGTGDGTYSFNHTGSFAYQDAVPEGPDRLTRVTRTEAWSEDLGDIFDHIFEDEITYNADGTQIVDTHETGAGNGAYTTSGSRSYFWSLEEGDLAAGDGLLQTYGQSSQDAPLPAWPNTDTYWYDYEDDLVRTLNAAGQQTAITGTSAREGGGRIGTVVTVGVTHTVQERDIAFDFTSTLSQSDGWSEVKSDNYQLVYADVITYSSDGSGALEHDILEAGTGHGSWDLATGGSFNWSAVSLDGTWSDTFQASYDRDYWDNYLYNYSRDTLGKFDPAGNELYRLGSIGTISQGGGGRQIQESNDYWYSYNSGNGVTKVIEYSWTHDACDSYWYLNQNTANYLGILPRVDYLVFEQGGGSGCYEYEWTSHVRYTSQSSYPDGSSSYTIDANSTSKNREGYNYHYTENWLTNVWADGSVEVQGTIGDCSGSSGSVETKDWGYVTSNSSGSAGSSYSNQTWDLQTFGNYSYAAAYLRLVSLLPNGWLTTGITGSEIINRWGSYTYIQTWSWSYSYNGTTESGSDSSTDTDSWNHSQTMTNEQYEGPRAGRNRMYGWGLSLLRFLRHGRF